MHEYGVKSYRTMDEIANSQNNELAKYDAFILTVAHRNFANFNINDLVHDRGVVYDVKGVLKEFDERL